MKVFIAGIGGFLGSELARALEARGHAVIGSTRETLPLGARVDPAVFEDADTVVHCAHDLRRGMLERNVTGARMLLEAAGCRHRIFIGSHSARADAVSEYAIAKYRIERSFLTAGETVVRPGLVIGNGGLFGRRLRFLGRSPVIPLIDGGRDRIAVLATDDFTAATIGLVEQGARGAYNLFNEDMPTMRELVQSVLLSEGRRAWLPSVPYSLAALLLREESLGTLRLNRQPVHQSHLRKLLGRETTLEAMLRGLTAK